MSPWVHGAIITHQGFGGRFSVGRVQSDDISFFLHCVDHGVRW